MWWLWEKVGVGGCCDVNVEGRLAASQDGACWSHAGSCGKGRPTALGWGEVQVSQQQVVLQLLCCGTWCASVTSVSCPLGYKTRGKLLLGMCELVLRDGGRCGLMILILPRTFNLHLILLGHTSGISRVAEGFCFKDMKHILWSSEW